MNKLLTKIVGIALGATMAIGVGVAIGASNKKTVPANATGESTYELITSTDGLTAGCNYLIGATNNGSGSNVDYFISKTSNTNNRKTTTGTVTSSKVTFDSTMLNVTLGGDSTNGWTFRTTNYNDGSSANQGFLDATSTTSNNYLKVTTGNSAGNYAKFSISITNAGIATITCNGKTSRHIMYFNYNSGTPMFSCYNSQTQATYSKVKLYKEIVPVTTLTLSDGENSYTSNTAINLYENAALNLSATVAPTTASDRTCSWSTDGNISGSNGSYTIGAYASGTTATVTCETNGKNASGNKISVVLSITILQDSREIDGIVVEGLDYNGSTFYDGHSAWDLTGVVYKAHFDNDTTETITGDDLNNLAVFWYADNTLSGDEISAPVTGLSSVYLYVMYDGDYGEADGGITLDGFTTVASSATYTRTVPSKTAFTTANKFIYGGTITEEWNYGTTNTYDQDDSEVTFELQNQAGTKIVDLIPNTTEMSTDYNGRYVSVKFNGTQVQQRYTITVTEAFAKNKGEYHLLTDASKLEVGSHIVIVADNADYMMKDGFTSTNNITGVAASKNATTLTIDKSKALDIELIAGSASGTYGFKLENGKGLYAGTSSNYLKADTIPSTITAAYSFALTYSGGWTIKCQASSGRNYVRYNPNNGSPIFSCYSGSTDQSAVTVYLFKGYDLEATEYSETFIKGSGNAGTCAATKSAWSTLSTNYGKLTDGAKALFVAEEHQDSTNFDGSTEYSVAHAVARYDQVLIANGTSTYNDFMGRTGVGGKLQLAKITTLAVESSNVTIIIAIISAVTLTAIGGYFFLRKRKEVK